MLLLKGVNPKLIADCWEHIFNYLSFRDILQMGQTCKRMNRMAGYYIRDFYPQLEFHLKKGKIYSQNVCLGTEFNAFIRRLVIWKRDDYAVKLLSNAETFDALKTIEFHCCELSGTQIKYLSEALKNVENIEIEYCKIVGNVFEQLANRCPKLKQMKIGYNMPSVALLYSQYYPNLECLRYSSSEYSRIDKLKTFIEKHSKLKQLHIDFGFLWANRDVLVQTNIQLDLLHVRFSDRSNPFDEFIEFLKILHGRNFYKTVQLSISWVISDVDRERISHAISSLPRFEKLFTQIPNLDLGRFTNLTELKIEQFDHTTINIETLAKSLPKLDQLVVRFAKIESILPFIRHTKNLKAIKIFCLQGSDLDLSALNNERKKLENACKVLIYVKDHVYLYPKWKSHNFNLELDLIKIQRYSFE